MNRFRLLQSSFYWSISRRRKGFRFCRILYLNFLYNVCLC